MIQHNNTPVMVDQNNGYTTYGGPVISPQRRLPARFIRDFNDIMPQEVPKDGSFAAFIRDDFTEVYILTMTLQGTQGYTFQLANNQQKQEDPMALIMEKLDRLEAAINKPHYNSKPKKPRPKQEVNGHGNG